MKASFRLILLGALTAMWAILPGAWAQETPPPDPVPVVAPAAVEPEKPVVAVDSPEKAEGELRRLDVVAPKSETPAVAPAKPAQKVKRTKGQSHGQRAPGYKGDEHVSVGSNIHIAEGRVVQDGVVGVLADVVIDGEVQDDVAVVLGSVVVNGTISGEIVVVLGDVTLGPKAHVGGQIVCVGGQVVRAPGAYVGGKIVNNGGKIHIGDGLNAWLEHAVRYGRPLAIGAHLGWVWLTTVAVLALYMLMGLAMPRQMTNCGERLAQRPVAVVVSAFLTMIALPLLFILLCVTGVGIPIALFVLPIAVVLCVLFGKASVYCLLGRAVSQGRLHPALAVLVGAIPFILLYLVPFFGFVISLFVALLGFGCSIVAIFSSRKKAAPAPVVPVALVAPASTVSPVTPGLVTPIVAAAIESGVTSAAVPVDGPASLVAPIAPVPLVAAMRAGFWIRMGALMIDLILVGVVCGSLRIGQTTIVMLALYGALLWKFRGTTIGGIVCGLKVVRLDGRVVDWPTAIVRALSCFVSLVVGGLGFVWVAFDPEKQSWHDKIAGTIVVRAAKGTSLV